MDGENSNGSKTGQYSIGLGGYHHGHHSWVSLLLGYLGVRTIKEFILGVLFVPALVCFFVVFGASAVYLQDKGIANIAKEATETATFATLEHYPLGFILA